MPCCPSDMSVPSFLPRQTTRTMHAPASTCWAAACSPFHMLCRFIPTSPDDKNYARTCLYLLGCHAYLPEPDDAAVVRTAFNIYSKARLHLLFCCNRCYNLHSFCAKVLLQHLLQGASYKGCTLLRTLCLYFAARRSACRCVVVGAQPSTPTPRHALLFGVSLHMHMFRATCVW